MAVGMIMFTRAGMVTDSRHGPHVVKRPYNGLSAGENAFKLSGGQQTLIYPMEVDNVGFLKCGQTGDVRSRACDVYTP